MTTPAPKKKGVGNNGNLIPAKKGEVRNPKGKPKGTKHISHWIDEMLNDPEFEATLIDSKKGVIEYKGAPIQAIIAGQIQLAIHNRDSKAFDVLAKYGYGSKQIVEMTNPVVAILQKFDLTEDGDARQAEKT